jgi:hypothetical protein
MAQEKIDVVTSSQEKADQAQVGTVAETPIRAPLVPERPHKNVSFGAAQLLFAGSIAADLGTTWTLPAGYVEGNPLLGKSKAQQLGVSIGLGVVTLWQARRLESHGHPNAARLCLWLGTALHSGAAAHNATVR